KKPVAPTPRPQSEPQKAGPRINDAEVNQLRFLIEAKRRAITDLEEFRSRRLTELQSQLAEQRVIYSAQHPTVTDTEQRISAFSKESPQIAALKRDEDALTGQLSTLIGKSGGSGEPRSRSGGLSAMDILLVGERPDDPVLSFAQDKLRIANAKYQDMLLRIDSARLELEASRAAFKYRYSVARPAQVPRTASKPNIPVIVIAGVVAAFLVALLTCLGRDLTSGRIVEPWQVTRQLGLNVVAQLRKGDAWSSRPESEMR
ncbi:MAG: PCP family exopolysaccharide biosynthesis protein EpsV, partial [Myxococcaceae bacterium]